jgi:hypothetical protein
LNDAQIRSSVCQSAVKGGNFEIIHICEQNHGNFVDCLSASVIYQRNDIADWLISNFAVNAYRFTDCFHSLNFPGIYYLLAQGSDVNEVVRHHHIMGYFIIF